MADLVLIALIGLLLLVPLEIAFLIFLGILKRRDKFPEPRLNIPKPTKPERYGWENIFKFKLEKKPKSSTKKPVLAVMLLIILGISVVGSVYIIFFSNLLSDLGLIEPEIADSVDQTITGTTPANITATAEDTLIFANFSVSHNFNSSLPEVNLSGIPTDTVMPYIPQIMAVIVAVLTISLVLGIFIYYYRRRKSAVIYKAKDTAETLIKKSEKSARNKKTRKSFPSGNPYVVPGIILFLLIIIAFLIYLAREKIKTELPVLAVNYISIANDFLFNYRFYILAGVLIVIINILILRKLISK